MFKIPRHLSKQFKSLEAVDREKFVQSYNIWFNHELTQEFLKDLSAQVESSVQKEDQRSDFVSWFELKYHAIKRKQERSTLRSIIKQLTPEV